MFCRKCGYEIQEEHKICARCGERVVSIQPVSVNAPINQVETKLVAEVRGISL